MSLKNRIGCFRKLAAAHPRGAGSPRCGRRVEGGNTCALHSAFLLVLVSTFGSPANSLLLQNLCVASPGWSPLGLRRGGGGRQGRSLHRQKSSRLCPQGISFLSRLSSQRWCMWYQVFSARMSSFGCVLHLILCGKVVAVMAASGASVLLGFLVIPRRHVLCIKY